MRPWFKFKCTGFSVICVVLMGDFTGYPAFANPNCFKEGTNNWQRCAATCSKACQDTRIDFKTVRTFCEPLARLDKSARKDDASCTAILQSASPMQSVQSCITKAASRPGLADLIKNEQLPAGLRDALSKRLSDPPSCAPNPAAIKTMTGCIETEIEQMRKDYDALAGKLAGSSSCRPLPEYGEIYKTLDASKSRAKNVEELISVKLFTCPTLWERWLDERAKRTEHRSGEQPAESAPSSERFSRMLDSMVGKLRESLKEASTKQTEVRDTVSHMSDSLDVIEADIAKAMLECN